MFLACGVGAGEGEFSVDGVGSIFQGGGEGWRDSTYSETSYDFDMHSHALAPSNFNNCFIFMNIVTIDVLIPPKKPLRTNRMFTT